MRLATLAAILLLNGCSAVRDEAPPLPVPASSGTSARLAVLESRLLQMVPNSPYDTLHVAIALHDLEGGDSLLISSGVVMHAASTMKVPVMLELFRRIDAGELSLDRPIDITNGFRSIADGSTYSLSPEDDSDPELFRLIGGTLPLGELMERMIVRSSNLATNLLIDLASPDRIARTIEEIGARGVTVLRGVEDLPAFRAGLNNTTTAYGLMKVMEAIVSGDGVSESSAAEMIRILEAQTFRETIPAGLPPSVRVGNKSGWITAIEHDAAIVMPPGRAPYVLVILTRGYRDRAGAQAMGSRISRAVWEELIPE